MTFFEMNKYWEDCCIHYKDGNPWLIEPSKKRVEIMPLCHL